MEMSLLFDKQAYVSTVSEVTGMIQPICGIISEYNPRLHEDHPKIRKMEDFISALLDYMDQNWRFEYFIRDLSEIEVCVLLEMFDKEFLKDIYTDKEVSKYRTCLDTINQGNIISMFMVNQSDFMAQYLIRSIDDLQDIRSHTTMNDLLVDEMIKVKVKVDIHGNFEDADNAKHPRMIKYICDNMLADSDLVTEKNYEGFNTDTIPLGLYKKAEMQYFMSDCDVFEEFFEKHPQYRCEWYEDL